MINEMNAQVPVRNPLVALLKGGSINWVSTDICHKGHIKEICKIAAEFGRSITINTGGHGTSCGLSPKDDGKLGDARFILEDIETAKEVDGKFSIHIISPYSDAIYPT